MSNVKFTQLANQATLADNTIIPTVNLGTNFTVTAANLKAYTSNVTTLTASGNISGNYILGNGSQLTGIVSSYGNSNVAAYLLTNTGNISANVISATGNVSGLYFIGDGSLLTGVSNYGNSNVAAYLPTFTGNLNPNIVSASGNITAPYFFGNGSQLTGLPATYGNSNVVSLLNSFGSNNIVTSGNITGGIFTGNGAGLTNLPAGILAGNLTGNIAGNGFSMLNIATITSAGTISAAGNITGANITGTHFGNGSQLSNIVTSLVAGSGISVNNATGVVTVTNNNPTPYTNANVAAYLPTYTGNFNPNILTANSGSIGVLGVSSTAATLVTTLGSTAMTITNSDSAGGGLIIQAGLINSNNIPLRIRNANGVEVANIGIAGQIQTASTISAVGNITGNFFIGNGSQLTGINGTYGNANVVSLLAAFGSNTINTTGNITTGAISGNGTVNINGDITATGFVAAGQIRTGSGTPTSTTVGTAGSMVYSSSHLYVCIATNTWKRISLSSF